MIRDVYRRMRSVAAVISGALGIVSSDSFQKPRGEIFWRLENTATGEVESGHIKNVVTLDASIMVARLLKSTAVPNLSEPRFGIYALALGTGDAGWDPMGPPSGNNAQRSLYNELGRKAIVSTQFVDALGNPSLIPTNVVDFTTIFTESEAVGPLTEMGLLGGDVSTNMAIRNPVLPPNGEYDPSVDVTGLDCLANYVTFPVINKPATSTLTWTWRIST